MVKGFRKCLLRALFVQIRFRADALSRCVQVRCLVATSCVISGKNGPRETLARTKTVSKPAGWGRRSDAMAAADALSVQVIPRRQSPVPPMPGRVDALLAETTEVDKVAQLGSRCVGNCPGRVAEGGDGQAESPQVAPPDDVFAGTRERSADRGRPTWSRSPHPGVRQPPVTAVESAAVLVESQHAVGGGVPDRGPHAAGLVRAFIPGQEGAVAIAPAGACPPSCGCRSPPSGRSGRTVRQLARCAQVRLEPAQARTYGSHACRSACMPRTVFTGRDLTQIVGRVEAQGLVGTSPDELGAGLPYG